MGKGIGVSESCTISSVRPSGPNRLSSPAPPPPSTKRKIRWSGDREAGALQLLACLAACTLLQRLFSRATRALSGLPGAVRSPRPKARGQRPTCAWRTGGETPQELTPQELDRWLTWSIGPWPRSGTVSIPAPNPVTSNGSCPEQDNGGARFLHRAIEPSSSHRAIERIKREGGGGAWYYGGGVALCASLVIP